MRTIVVFQAGPILWYEELNDRPTPPERGKYYIYRGKRYQTVDVTECLGVNTPDGSRRRSGLDKLIEILTAFNAATALPLVATLTSIGSGDPPVKSEGGLIMSMTALLGEFDEVVFVRLKLISEGNTDLADVLRTAENVHRAHSKTAELPTAAATTAAGLPPIRVGEPAASEG